jgi:hypothetical protein
VAAAIRAAALVPMSFEVTQAVFNLGCMVLMHSDAMAAILAGRCSEEQVTMFANVVWPMSEPK